MTLPRAAPPVKMSDVRRAWVDEDKVDENWEARTAIAAARFSVHIEDESLTEGMESGPADVPLAVALRWARTRAAVVILRVYDRDGSGESTLFSAGSRRPTGFNPRLANWEDAKRPLRRQRIRW